MTEFSPTRTHATWKPRVTQSHLPFYRCPKCNAVFLGVDANIDTHYVDDGERSLRLEPAYTGIEINPSCCGTMMEKIEPISWEKEQDQFIFDYQIMGGFNNNALEVNWKSINPKAKPRWFALKTFTGIQLKYLSPKKWPPIVFAFADEDAFAYCNKPLCEECTFRCKSGMELYAYVEDEIGLLVRPMDRMTKAGMR